MLLQARGTDVLRVKGLLNVGGDGPLVINGVQHVVHPPEHLPRGRTTTAARGSSSSAAGSRGEELERSLAAFNAAARPK